MWKSMYLIENILDIHTQYFFLVMPHGMQDLSSLIRDGTHDPCSESTES